MMATIGSISVKKSWWVDLLISSMRLYAPIARRLLTTTQIEQLIKSKVDFIGKYGLSVRLAND